MSKQIEHMTYPKFHMEGKIVVIDDRFEIPEEIQNMSEDELAREIAILEEEGRKVAKTLPDMEPLFAVR